MSDPNDELPQVAARRFMRRSLQLGAACALMALLVADALMCLTECRSELAGLRGVVLGLLIVLGVWWR